MEQSRLLIAIALSFFVFLLWNIFFSPPVPQVPVVEETRPPAAQAPAPGNDRQPGAPGAPLDVIEPGNMDRAARNFTIDTHLYTIKLSERGAAVVDMVLKNYRESVEANSPPKSLISEAMEGGSVLLSFNGDPNGELAAGVYQTDENRERIVVGSQPFTLRFVHQTQEGLRVEKAYTFMPDSYLIGLSVNLINNAGYQKPGQLHVAMRNLISWENQSYGFEGPSGLINNSLVQIKPKNIDEQEQPQGLISWVANETRYFMTSVIPQQSLQGQMVPSYQQKLLSNQMVISGEPIGAQQSRRYDFNLFMGPKSYSTLRSFDNGLDRAINFGWFDFIAKPCLWFMNFIYRFLPNYGIAIIILTIVTRLAFWPLAAKSYKSMNEMRKLQPLMQEIREKHKNDKARMNQEVMALYRTYKINPLGGCLPMLVQLPVFFALYQMLYQAIELRHAPFIGWIRDLSAPDRLFNFGFTIPLMEPPYGIPVLTLIMGGTMFLQQKMSPPPGDPAQARMMMLLPIVFTFIFINFSSGLVLYWLVSNVLSIGQQYYTLKKMA
jgi:YidC/Oxa1 family membrane protein insertase